MKNLALIFLAALFLAACNLSDSSVEFSGDLAVGELVEGTLEVETPDTFRLELEAMTFLYGEANQLTVDVVVTLYDSAGTVVGRVDGPARGPEIFTFEVKKAGRYLLEIKPFEQESGDYTLELKRVEAFAKTPEGRAEQLFLPYSGKDQAGGVVGVIQDGKVIFSSAHGMANLTYAIPYEVNTPSNIGSVSKQFTAMAILLLEKQGKLSLEDDVREYIPELPDLGQVVTLRNMLNHTNGFREVYNLMPMTGWKGEDVLLREEVLEILKRQEKLQAAPGEEYNYNNSAFIMLAEIVERISGQTFPEFMEEQVFGPLGMRSTVVRPDPATVVPEASQGYVADSAGFHIAGDLYASYGAGGIYTTVEDFSKWMGNFADPVVGDRELIARMVHRDTLNNGDTLNYGLGIGVDEVRGLVTYSHGGADIAHRAYLMYFPELNAGAVAMSNNAVFDPAHVAYEMAAFYFGEEMEQAGKAKEGPEDETEEMEENAEETRGRRRGIHRGPLPCAGIICGRLHDQRDGLCAFLQHEGGRAETDHGGSARNPDDPAFPDKVQIRRH
jgi:CubicO group peptidase (beta-lactamase class C family)